MSQSGWIACFIVVAQNCKRSHLFYMFLANIYSHLRSVYKQELSQRTMRMQTWLGTSVSTTNRNIAKNSITTSAMSVNAELVARSK